MIPVIGGNCQLVCPVKGFAQYRFPEIGSVAVTHPGGKGGSDMEKLYLSFQGMNQSGKIRNKVNAGRVVGMVPYLVDISAGKEVSISQLT